MSHVSYSTFHKELFDTTSENSYKEFILRCPFEKCGCRIIAFKYSDGVLDRNTVQVSETPECVHINKETLEISKDEDGNGKKTFFKVPDAWNFDNIGVSRPTEIKQPVIHGTNDLKVDIQRYLVCADCERGPIGFAGNVGNVGESEDERVQQASNLMYFLSAESVRFDRK